MLIDQRQSAVPESVKLETCDCPLCGSAESAFVLRGFDRLHRLPGVFTVVRCTRCGLMRTNPRPTRDTIGFYYPDEYGPYQYTRVERGQPPATSRGWRRAVRRMMDTRSMALPGMAPGRMLEIGCASGGFLDAMQRQGWSVQGVEFSPTAAESARNAGLNVFSGSIDDAPLDEHGFDLIVAWMVIEHLHDPVAALKRLRRAAAANAALAFSVPNAAALEFRVFRDAAYALQVPTHLFHFTPRTIGKVLEAAGWKTERVLHQRTLSNIVGGLGNVAGDYSGGSKIGRMLQQFPDTAGRIHDILFPLAFVLGLLGQTGRMTIWARPV